MAGKSRTQRPQPESFNQAQSHIHPRDRDTEDEHDQRTDRDDASDESRDPMDESNGNMSDSDEEAVEQSVAEDMDRFERTFEGFTKKYRLINRIGEGSSPPLAGLM